MKSSLNTIINKTIYQKIIFIVTLVALVSCGSDGDDQNTLSTQESQITKEERSKLLFTKVKKVNVHVFYEDGAEPFTDSTKNDVPFWNFFKDNVKSLFQYRSTAPSFIIPTQLSEMIKLNTSSKEQWTTTDIYNLYQGTKRGDITKEKADFHIYFLNGKSKDGDNIIGLSLSNTFIIAIFKDVIKNSGGEIVARYVEQSTLVHEFGHAVGLVNSGVPLASQHQDDEHGSHTINEDCVMYYQNEGMSDLLNYIKKIRFSNSVIMWGNEVLADVKNISE